MKTNIAIFVSVAFCFCFCHSLQAESPRTWTGKWNNRKYGTSGPLKCVAETSQSGRWTAVFNGTFKGDPFEYRVDFQSKASSGREALDGTARISGHPYEWTGSIDDRQLKGSYRSTNGNNGTFVLNESRSRSNPQPQRQSRRRADSPVTAVPDLTAGEKLLFIGNSLMANEGGVNNYLARAVQTKLGFTIQTDSIINYGRPLSAMVKRDVGNAIAAADVDRVVITSGQLNTMQKFVAEITKVDKQPIVFMTWEPRHPGNRGTEASYTNATKNSVRTMRQLQQETGATIIPVAVVYHSLTTQPPQAMPRVDYLWQSANIHQNELGTLVNAWMLYAMLTNKSPVGVDFDMPQHVVGETIKSDPSLKLTDSLRQELQQRVWEVAQAWKAGKTHLE